MWETIEAENPDLWNEFKSNDINAMIDELVRYKQTHYPDDRRRILTCGILAGQVRVEWLNAAAPGVDAKWEMRLYGLVRTGKRKEAIRFLQETRLMTRNEASRRVSDTHARRCCPSPKRKRGKRNQSPRLRFGLRRPAAISDSISECVYEIAAEWEMK